MISRIELSDLNFTIPACTLPSIAAPPAALRWTIVLFTGRNSKPISTGRPRFAADPAHVRWQQGRLYLSSILDWYGQDFVDWFPSDAVAEEGLTEEDRDWTVVDYLRLYGPQELVRQLPDNADVTIEFNEYDWALNACVLQRKKGL
jgi:hypothetical protein